MICIEGIIIPSDWDDNGKVIGLTIATSNEKEYPIAGDDQMAQLKPFLRQEVMIKGTLQDEKGKTYLHVQNITQRKCSI